MRTHSAHVSRAHSAHIRCLFITVNYVSKISAPNRVLVNPEEVEERNSDWRTAKVFGHCDVILRLEWCGGRCGTRHTSHVNTSRITCISMVSGIPAGMLLHALNQLQGPEGTEDRRAC